MHAVSQLRHGGFCGLPLLGAQAFDLHDQHTTTERYLHYAPDPDAAAKLSGLWGVPPGTRRRRT